MRSWKKSSCSSGEKQHAADDVSSSPLVSSVTAVRCGWGGVAECTVAGAVALSVTVSGTGGLMGWATDGDPTASIEVGTAGKEHDW